MCLDGKGSSVERDLNKKKISSRGYAMSVSTQPKQLLPKSPNLQVAHLGQIQNGSELSELLENVTYCEMSSTLRGFP